MDQIIEKMQSLNGKMEILDSKLGKIEKMIDALIERVQEMIDERETNKK